MRFIIECKQCLKLKFGNSFWNITICSLKIGLEVLEFIISSSSVQSELLGNLVIWILRSITNHVSILKQDLEKEEKLLIS